MRNLQELLGMIVLIVSIALFLAGLVWRLYRGDPDAGRRR